MTFTQANRSTGIVTPFGDDVLVLRNLRWRESLGEPFLGSLSLVSETSDLDPNEILGQSVTIRLGPADESPTYLHGMVTEFAMTGQDRGYFDYQLRVVPWFALLMHAGGSAIYQQQSVVEIAKAVFETRGFTAQVEDRLTQTYRERAYCVQYAESDFHFLSRLFEEEGIYYFFEYSQDGHTMILADDISAHPSADGLTSLPYHDLITDASEACVADWTQRQEFQTANFVLRDYDFQKPKSPQIAIQNSSDQISSWTWNRFPGRFFDSEDGGHYAKVQSESVVAHRASSSVAVSVPGLQAGKLLSITSHPNEAINQEYLLTGCEIETSSANVYPESSEASFESGLRFQSKLDLQPSSVPFRSMVKTPRPHVVGPQMAIVVGPDGEEIWTDNYGRIKVKFTWDASDATDDSCSCWIRVSQPLTGKGWGAMSVPRIGEEVLVDFYHGDIDRPIVTGRVHNATRMPPDALAEAQAKTIFRTRSTKGGDTNCFHELTFDDTKDAESIYLRSERDFQRVVENNDSLKVGYDKADPGDQSIDVYNNREVSIGVGSGGGSLTETIANNRTVEIQQGDDTLNVNQGSITIQAATSITLQCGDSSIEIRPDGITVNASEVQINGDAKVSIQAPEVDVQADSSLAFSAGGNGNFEVSGGLTLRGALVQIN